MTSNAKQVAQRIASRGKQGKAALGRALGEVVGIAAERTIQSGIAPNAGSIQPGKTYYAVAKGGELKGPYDTARPVNRTGALIRSMGAFTEPPPNSDRYTVSSSDMRLNVSRSGKDAMAIWRSTTGKVGTLQNRGGWGLQRIPGKAQTSWPRIEFKPRRFLSKRWNYALSQVRKHLKKALEVTLG